MDEKWTPGPWFWDAGLVPPDGPERYADIYVDGGETIIAGFNDFIPEGRANANLIAAAPDLYAALEAMTARMSLYSGHHDDALTAMGKAALAKARGHA